MWLLVLSPFLELLYRGWMQPRVQRALGRWPGLLATSLAFTLWHLFPGFAGSGTATLPLTSLLGIASTFLAGVLFGYLRDRTDGVIAAWLAHAIGGLGLVLIGRMAFLTYVPKLPEDTDQAARDGHTMPGPVHVPVPPSCACWQCPQPGGLMLACQLRVVAPGWPWALAFRAVAADARGERHRR